MNLPCRVAVRTCLVLTSAFLYLVSPPGLPRVAWSGVLNLSPNVEFGFRADRPASARSAGRGWVARTTPQLQVTHLGATSTLALSGSRSFDSQERAAGPVRSGDEAGLRLVSYPARHSKLVLDAHYLNSRDPLDLDSTAPLSFSESAVASGNARLDLWRLEGEYQVRSHTYGSARANDAVSQAWDVAAFPIRQPETDGVIGWHGRDERLNRSPVLASNVVTVGFRRRHLETFMTQLEVGAAETRQLTRGLRSWDLALIAGATAQRGTLWLPVDVDFRIERDIATTGYVEASLPGYRSRLSARLERTLGAEGGVFHDPTLARYLTFGVTDTLAGQYRLTVEGSFGRTRSFGAAGPWLRTGRAWADLARPLLSWLTLGLEYSYLNQDANPEVTSWAFRRSRVGLRLTMGAQ